MTTSTLVFFVLFLLAVSIRASYNDGRSDYCLKSQRNSGFIPTPIECCNTETKCSDWIAPNEFKHNLTNPDPEWSRRLCSCDEVLYKCVTKGLSREMINRAKSNGFKDEICFRKVRKQLNALFYIDLYEFVPLLDTLFRTE